MLNLQAYKAHEALVAPARATAQLWRLIIGVILIAGTVLLASQFISQTLITFFGGDVFGALTGMDGRGSQLSVLYLLSSFGLLTLGVTVALRVAHHRGFLAVLGHWPLFRQQFIAVLTMLFLINLAIVVLPPWSVGAPIAPNVPFSDWLLVLPFAVAAILVQVSAEEIFFRGYLQQQLAARFASPAIWLFVPSALFGLGHYMPEIAGENALILAVWAGLFGLAMADVTARAGTLGPAVAIHFMHNAIAILFVSVEDNLSGLSLYYLQIDLEDVDAVRALFPIEFMTILLSWLGARLAIRR